MATQLSVEIASFDAETFTVRSIVCMMVMFIVIIIFENGFPVLCALKCSMVCDD